MSHEGGKIKKENMLKWGKPKMYMGTEAAYLAGCIDCDGSISIVKGNRPKVNIVSVHRGYLERIQEIAGCGNIYLFKKERKNGKYVSKDMYEFHIGAAKFLKAFLEQIEPYLILKKEKARKTLRFLDGVNAYG